MKGPDESVKAEPEAENLLMEMSVTLNNLCRFYDEKNENGIKFIMTKVYELSHKGIAHLTLLDELAEENTRLRELIEKALHFLHDYGNTGIQDIQYRKDLRELEYEIKRQFKKDNNL